MLWNSVDEVVLFKTEYRFVTPFVYELAATNQFMKFLLGHRLPSSFCETYDDCETFYQLHEAAKIQSLIEPVDKLIFKMQRLKSGFCLVDLKDSAVRNEAFSKLSSIETSLNGMSKALFIQK